MLMEGMTPSEGSITAAQSRVTLNVPLPPHRQTGLHLERLNFDQQSSSTTTLHIAPIYAACARLHAQGQHYSCAHPSRRPPKHRTKLPHDATKASKDVQARHGAVCPGVWVPAAIPGAR